ncbi:hypothetical protein BOTBODRAFT_36915 [Botryobasidium botryosum FD-172 SS1]|uniref:Exonuclease domain-containing protein n=1 Tax=Botryobasidium botryosum (strain FD-172 SS1) TaxID=930990 RepID=A0A067M466_BOTB1|nr:hypothetical protein BOTBODRAFT_36915 [Botryobasidium botryosum FD-172 SS1]
MSQVATALPMMGSPPEPGASSSKKRPFEDLESERMNEIIRKVTGEKDPILHEDKRKLKKQKKKREKEPLVSLPSFAFQASDLRSRTQAVSLDEVRSIIVGIATDAPAQTLPKFLACNNRSSIKRTVLLYVPGISPVLLGLQPAPISASHESSAIVHPASLFAARPPTPAQPASALKLAPAFPLPLPRACNCPLPVMTNLFSHACPTRAPGDLTRIGNILNTLLVGPSTVPATVYAKEKDQDKDDDGWTEVKKGKRKGKRASQSQEDSTPVPLSALVLSPMELASESYMVPSYLQSSSSSTALPSHVTQDISIAANGWNARGGVPVHTLEWVETPLCAPSSDGDEDEDEDDETKQKVFAIDCEMVQTDEDKELARVCVVDYWTRGVVYDQLVRPTRPIQDYLTQFSGITPEMLESVTTTLADVQKHFLSTLMIDSRTILIGHSLSSDLRALKLAHPRCIDTSVCFQHTRGPPSKPGLKWLTQRWLGREIQMTGGNVGSGAGGRVGHCPEEDALACVDLLKKKQALGMRFGMFERPLEQIFETAAKASKTSVYVGSGAATFGSKATLAVECEGDEEVMENIISALPTHDFAFGRLQGLSRALGWTDPAAHAHTQPPSLSSPEVQTALTTLNAQLQKISGFPPHTAIVILTGSSDPLEMARLNKKKHAWDAKVREARAAGSHDIDVPDEDKWTTADGRALEDECERTKAGLVFFCITLPR